MFAWWGSWVSRFRWAVVATVLAAVVVSGVWGIGVFGQLTEGGYNDPGSESTRAATAVQEALGPQGGDAVVIFTPVDGSIDDADVASAVQDRLDALPGSDVVGVASYWQSQSPQFAAADKSSAVAVLTLAGDDDGEKLEAFRDVRDKLDIAGVRTQIAGAAALQDASSTRSTNDLTRAEAFSLPIVLILLLLIFGSLVAAALPVVVGGCAVLGALGVLHAIALVTEVNSFAVNVASLLGLGMAIDYGLFMVGRFREEQNAGRTPAEAVARTVATAGRTVVFSATLLMIALAGLLLFPQGFLKSLAYGGMAAVALAALTSLTLLPALLAVLGPRVDKLPVRLPRRRRRGAEGAGWTRLADVVLRRPVLVAVPIIALLGLLASPIAGVRFGEVDERVLPPSDPARQAIETLKSDYPALGSNGVQIVLRGRDGEAPDASAGAAFASAVEAVAGIDAVDPTGSGGDVLVLTATLAGSDPFGAAARDAVENVRALPAPSGVEVLVGGTTARNVDSLDATAAQLPLMVALLVGATLILMFLAFGSILLPVKAVVLSALSLSATFGILVWIFQDGHGAGALNVTPAPMEVGIVVLMAAVVFGLSTDYEVFLLSRMVEARTRGASTVEAVSTGLIRTGRVISAAALLLVVVTGAFALSSLTTMRFIGVGMIIALILDATVVRMLLVPAILRLLGDAAWWAPGPLRRLQQRAGLQEYDDDELFPVQSVGRHAAPETGEIRRPARALTAAAGHAAAPAGSVAVPAVGVAPAVPPTEAEPSAGPAVSSPGPVVSSTSAPLPTWLQIPSAAPDSAWARRTPSPVSPVASPSVSSAAAAAAAAAADPDGPVPGDADTSEAFGSGARVGHLAVPSEPTSPAPDAPGSASTASTTPGSASTVPISAGRIPAGPVPAGPGAPGPASSSAAASGATASSPSGSAAGSSVAGSAPTGSPSAAATASTSSPGPAPATSGTAAPGTAAPGPAAPGPAALGTAPSGHAAFDPAAPGPAVHGPAAPGPAVPGPAALGTGTSGAGATGPAVPGTGASGIGAGEPEAAPVSPASTGSRDSGERSDVGGSDVPVTVDLAKFVNPAYTGGSESAVTHDLSRFMSVGHAAHASGTTDAAAGPVTRTSASDAVEAGDGARPNLPASDTPVQETATAPADLDPPKGSASTRSSGTD